MEKSLTPNFTNISFSFGRLSFSLKAVIAVLVLIIGVGQDTNAQQKESSESQDQLIKKSDTHNRIKAHRSGMVMSNEKRLTQENNTKIQKPPNPLRRQQNVRNSRTVEERKNAIIQKLNYLKDKNCCFEDIKTLEKKLCELETE